MVQPIQCILNGILLGGVYAAVSIAFIVIYRSTRVFNFSQGELVLVGGFLCWTVLTYAPLPWWLSLIVAIVATAGVGLLLERLAIRPLIGQQLFSIVMVTIALVLVLRGLVVMIWGTFPRRFPALFGNTGIPLGPFTLSPSLLFGVIAAGLIVVGLWWMFNRTRVGLTMSAVAEDHQTASALGISVKQSMSIAWAMAGGVSVIAAVAWLCGRSIGLPVADIGLVALPCVLLAGLESVPGALAAGIIVGIAESLSMYYLDPLTEGGMSLVMPFLIMMLVLIIRPEGLFGWKRIERL